MRTWTQRQYAATLAWVQEQWNHPSRSDHYAMQIAVAVMRLFAKNPKAVKMADCKLKFGSEKDKPAQAITKEQATAISKARWLGMMTAPVTVVQG